MGKSSWIIFGIVVLAVFSLIFLFFVWKPFIENKKVPESQGMAMGTSQNTPFQAENNPLNQGVPPGAENQTGQNPETPAESPKEIGFKPPVTDELKKFSDIFWKKFNDLTNLSPQSASDSFSSQSISTKKKQPIASVPEATSTEIILSLTDNEFHFLYPDDFIASLMDGQNFIKEYDPNYASFSRIETDSQVRFIEEKIVATLFSANMFTKEETERAITTIRFTLPQLQLTELKTRKSFILNQSFMSFPSPLLPSLKGSFFAELAERLYSAFIPEAQAYACGYCYTWSPCFQSGASGSTGLNVFMAFCYCTGCFQSFGCLSYCTGRAAIFDPTTFICGCG